MVYMGETEGHQMKNSIEGRFVILEDRSLWEVAQSDRHKPTLWLKSDSITVLDNLSHLYPHKLVNYGSGDTIEARYLGRLGE